MARRRKRQDHPLGPLAPQPNRTPPLGNAPTDAEWAARYPGGPNEPYMILNDSSFQQGRGIERAVWWLVSLPFRLLRAGWRRLRSR